MKGRGLTGTQASAILLKARLNEIGISALIKNDSPDSFLITAPQVVDLYINKIDFGKAIFSLIATVVISVWILVCLVNLSAKTIKLARSRK